MDYPQLISSLVIEYLFQNLIVFSLNKVNICYRCMIVYLDLKCFGWATPIYQFLLEAIPADFRMVWYALL